MRRLVVAALAALAGLLAYAVVSAVAHGSAIEAQVRALSSENGRLQQQIDERRIQIGEANSTDWLREQARKLGFAYPGETIYILSTPGVPGPSSGGVNATLPTYAPPTARPTPGTPTAAVSPSAGGSGSPSPTPVTFPAPSPTAH